MYYVYEVSMKDQYKGCFSGRYGEEIIRSALTYEEIHYCFVSLEGPKLTISEPLEPSDFNFLDVNFLYSYDETFQELKSKMIDLITSELNNDNYKNSKRLISTLEECYLETIELAKKYPPEGSIENSPKETTVADWKIAKEE